MQNPVLGEPTTRVVGSSRKILFCLVLLLASWLFIEGVSLVLLSITNRSFFSYKQITTALSAEAKPEDAGGIATTANLKWGDYVEALHPYLGFVADPNVNRGVWDVSAYGFIFSGGKSNITKRGEGKLVVAVFGGSFANGVYLSLKALFESKAVELGKSVEVVNFSLAGYKQPQQLMALNYMLAQGAEFDVVINIDGFNDITLSALENAPKQVNPFYPRSWESRTAQTISQRDLRQIGYIELLKDRKVSIARTFLQLKLYISPTLCLCWKAYDRSLSRRIYITDRELAATRSNSTSYTTRGPAYEFGDDARMRRDLVNLWKRCSIQMARLCDGANTRYYHFLQPNQYVPDSKPMTASENQRAISRESPYQPGVLAGYPLLKTAGKDLVAQRVDFTDFTSIFDHTKDEVYDDNCCHLNKKGYDMIAQAIYDHIYRSKPGSN